MQIRSSLQPHLRFARLLETGAIRYVPVSTLLWRIHGESASHATAMIDSGLRYWNKLAERHASGEDSPVIARYLTLRFMRVFLSNASRQLLADDPLFRQNLAAAEALVPRLSHVDRCAFAVTRWAWRSKTFPARCARSWFLNGLQRSTDR